MVVESARKTYASDELARTDSVRETESTRSLDATSYILDGRAIVAFKTQTVVDASKVVGGDDLEAGDDAVTGESVDGGDGALGWYLDLEFTFSETETLDDGDAGGHVGLEDDVRTGDTEIDAALTDERGDIGGRKEDSGLGWVGMRARTREKGERTERWGGS